MRQSLCFSKSDAKVSLFVYFAKFST
jgi:hypothetical protein